MWNKQLRKANHSTSFLSLSSRLETLASLCAKNENGNNDNKDGEKGKDHRNKRTDKKGGLGKEEKKRKNKKKPSEAEKDFLRRNVELAGEGGGGDAAAGAVRMTEEEKRRLLELLADVEAELSLETIDEADEESHTLQVREILGGEGRSLHLARIAVVPVPDRA